MLPFLGEWCALSVMGVSASRVPSIASPCMHGSMVAKRFLMSGCFSADFVGSLNHPKHMPSTIVFSPRMTLCEVPYSTSGSFVNNVVAGSNTLEFEGLTSLSVTR